MADIIQSSDEPAEEVMNDFKKMVHAANNSYSDKILSPLTITLGDEFQGVVQDLQTATDIIFFMELQILYDVYFDLRYVVHHGIIETAINKKNAYEMLGSGLTEARNRLGQLKKEDVRISITGLEKHNNTIQMVFDLYCSFYAMISRKDRKLLASFLENDNYRQIAAEYGRDISSMWRKRRSLNVRDFYTIKKLVFQLIDEYK